MPLPLSIAIVCKNNEATITRTLESVKDLASEIVALDSGSTDRTIPILESFGARVIRTEWRGHIATKQKALEACTQPWALSIDSDESLEPHLQESLRAALTANPPSNPAVPGYQINRKVFYRGRFLHHAWQPEWRLRLVRKDAAHWTGIDPHDMLVLKSGTPGRLKGDLRHDSFETFEEQLRKQVHYARLMADGLVAQGHRGSYLNLFLSAPSAFLKQLVLKQAFRDGWPGWLAAAAAAQQALVKHALIIELARGKPKP